MFLAVEKIIQKNVPRGKIERKIFTESLPQQRSALVTYNRTAAVREWRNDSFKLAMDSSRCYFGARQ
jgi:hypothetical protein